MVLGIGIGVGGQKVESPGRPHSDAGLDRVVPGLGLGERRTDQTEVRKQAPITARIAFAIEADLERIGLDEDRQVFAA